VSGAAGAGAPDRARVNLLVVGVGGQGVLTAARLLGAAALDSGREAVLGQLHGMSQRGGSVESTVLIGPGHSSFIEPGAADLVLGLEPLEVLRARPRMSARTRVVVNVGRVVPYTLAQAGRDYPEMNGVLDGIRAVAPDLVEVDGSALAEAAGEPRTLNIVMLGVLAGLGLLPFDGRTLWRAVELHCPPRYLEHNRRAFELGQEAA
jgi:indolepyruvate ferredoxin oxidoreductase beta subunit